MGKNVSDIYQLVYLSEAKQFIPEDEIKSILARARLFNKNAGVTGCLLYCSGLFLQLLEGDEGTVENLVAKIKNDPRHWKFNMIYEGLADVRFFANWSMHYKKIDDFSFTLRERVEDVIGKISHGEALYDAKDVLNLFPLLK